MSWTAWSGSAGGGGGGSVNWGDIGGTLANQVDLASALSAKAPLDSPTFTTKTTHSYATASTAATFNASKELVSSAVTTTELALLSGKTSLMSGAGTVVDQNIPVFNGTTGTSLKQLTGFGIDTSAGVSNPYIKVGAGTGVISASVTVWELTSGGAMYLSKSSGANFFWNTDQAGDIGASGGNRPANAFIAKNLVVGTGANATTATDRFLYITSCAGAPTGTPTSYTGRVPLVYDSNNNALYVYNGAWKSVALA